MSDPEVLLRAEAVTKRYPGTTALDQVNFTIYRGKVNVLIGENGAGKSTLVKIIAGIEQPTSGCLVLNGAEVRFPSARDADAHSIGMIHQELNLCPNLTVTENIFLGREATAHGVIDQARQEETARRLLERLEQPIDPRAEVGTLRLGEQQIVEIAKALARDVRILIMDEPTSALSPGEVDALFRVIGELTSRGVAIVYISHRLEELLRIGDFVTVLRDGRLVAEAPAAQVDLAWIVGKMVGGKLDSLFQSRPHEIGASLLDVHGLSLPRPGGGLALDSVSFTVARGEILGIYGLLGAGRTELLETLAGLHPLATGTVALDGRPIDRLPVAERIARGVVLVPEDRQAAGIVPTLAVRDNMILASLGACTVAGILDPAKVDRRVDELVRDLSIKVASSRQPITSLSGGNQQKVVIAKCLLTAPRLLLLDEPTRGIDVGAKAEISEIMGRLAEQGLGIVFSSSELEEVTAMADRILVLSKGRVTGEFRRGEASGAALAAAASADQRRKAS